MKGSIVKSNAPQRSMKFTLIGDGAVGKTCLLHRYCHGTFPHDYVPTTLDTFTKNVQVPGIGNIELSLWDTFGGEDYGRLRPLSFPGTDVMLICFSIASPASLDNAGETWIQEARHHLPEVPILLVGCQVDLRNDPEVAKMLEQRGKQQPCSFDEGTVIALKIGAAQYVECSSLLGDGVTEVFEAAIRAAARVPVKKPRYRERTVCVIF
ncbi:GTP-binding protein rho5 [Flagelloscypha sp. PMI_526]|nr:GTP-binding protein rho5 [Flagelloscypha sp. PMI_526]